ncbi:MAG: PspC domain-containing protein [Bacteroidota bacterium]|nr:PspC domain-containing protein [Bacteroidota bacterium]
MDRTIKINLGGTLFQIDEEAYRILKRYLQDIDDRLKSTPGGAETIEDIESRIAEIFQSQGGTAGVITRENVEAMMAIIGKPEDIEAGSEERDERQTHFHSSTGKKMYRNPDDKIISGVCGGIGAYLGIEPVWVRLLFILFACFFALGIFVYIALWIALPDARNDAQKREMYGGDFRNRGSRDSNPGNRSSYAAVESGVTRQTSSSVGNAVNEVFRAIGKVFFIIFRVFLILLGVTFVVTGFFFLVSFVMIFFFKYPGYFSTHSFGVNIFYLPDFLNYVVSPAAAPWILALSFIVILMPLLALIYWGVKMIFWFRARDGIFAITGLIIWVMSVAALSIILFNEGVSYAEFGKTVSEEVIPKTPPELYIKGDHKVADLKYDKEISLTDEDYNVYFNDDNKGLFISTMLDINKSDDKSLRIDVRKRSMGRSRQDAMNKADGLIYSYRMSADTLFIDEYFSIPANSKWSADNVRLSVAVPEGTVVHFDRTTEKMLHASHNDGWDWDSDSGHDERISSTPGDQTWVMTEEGLRRGSEKSRKEK